MSGDKGKESYPDIPGFEIKGILGRGAMGAVYEAVQLSMERPVALKVIRECFAENEAYVARFLREAKAMGRLNHPNVVQGFDSGKAGRYYYIAMELIRGRSLDSILEDGGRLPEDRAVEMARQVLSALQHANEQGIVHRDIKPSNIIEREDGVFKVTDFGLARAAGDPSLTMSGQTVGTPLYLSPELATGKGTVDIRTDLYSLGATLYHLVSGRPPFQAPSAIALLAAHANETPVPVHDLVDDVSFALSRFIARLMVKHPDLRPGGPVDALSLLDELLSGRSDPLSTLCDLSGRGGHKGRPGKGPEAADLTSTRPGSGTRRSGDMVGGASTDVAFEGNGTVGETGVVIRPCAGDDTPSDRRTLAEDDPPGVSRMDAPDGAEPEDVDISVRSVPLAALGDGALQVELPGEGTGNVGMAGVAPSDPPVEGNRRVRALPDSGSPKKANDQSDAVALEGLKRPVVDSGKPWGTVLGWTIAGSIAVTCCVYKFGLLPFVDGCARLPATHRVLIGPVACLATVLVWMAGFRRAVRNPVIVILPALLLLYGFQAVELLSGGLCSAFGLSASFSATGASLSGPVVPAVALCVFRVLVASIRMVLVFSVALLAVERILSPPPGQAPSVRSMLKGAVLGAMFVAFMVCSFPENLASALRRYHPGRHGATTASVKPGDDRRGGQTGRLEQVADGSGETPVLVRVFAMSSIWALYFVVVLAVPGEAVRRSARLANFAGRLLCCEQVWTPRPPA